MKRLRATTLRFALAFATSGTALVLLAPSIAFAQNEPLTDDLAIARQCIVRGVYGESLDRLIDPFLATRPDAYVAKALNLAGRAKIEGNKALIGQAKAALAKAGSAKGAQEAAAALENMPEPRWGNGHSEGNLVWALKNRALVGLAQQCAEGAIKSAGLAGSDLVEMKVTLADLLGERSRTPELEPDAAKRKAYFDQAKALLTELATGSADSLIMAKGTLYDIYYKHGSGLLEASKRNSDQEDALKKEALEAFKDAVAFLADETKKMDDERSKAAPPPAEAPKEGEEKKDAGPPPPPPSEHCYKYAKFYWPKSLVGQAKCTVDKAEHDKLVKAACDIYNDYNLEFGSDWENYGFEAAIDMSEAYQEIHDDENATISLESALAIEKQASDYDPLHPPDPKKGLTLSKEQLDVFARASLKKGAILKQKRDWKKAFAVYDKVFIDAVQSKIPDFEKNPLAQAIKIERAECLARDGKQKEAIKELEKMVADDPTGPVGQKANVMLARVRSGGGGSSAGSLEEGLKAERALALMNENLDKEDFHTAMLYARAVLSIAKRDSVEAQFNPKGYLGLGKCFENQRRLYEAAVCFEEVIRRYKDAPEAGDAALEEVKCFHTLKSVLPNGYDKDAYDRALQFLTSNFPNAGKGIAPFLLGSSLKEEGKFEEAYKAYDQVTSESGKFYDEALFSSSLCRYLLAKAAIKDKKDPKGFFIDTENTLKKALDVYSKEEPGMTEDRKTARKNLDADSRFLLADVLLQESINKPADIIPLFENADKAYEGNPDRLSRAGLNRILAYKQLKQLDKAEEQLKVLLEKYKGQKRTILACKEVGQALHRESGENKNLSPEDRRKIRVRICDYYGRWIVDGMASTDARPSVKDMLETSKALFQFALDVGGLPEDGGFVSEAEDSYDAGPAKQAFSDARDILLDLATKPDLNLGKARSTVFALLGESAAFVHDWPTARKGFEMLVEENKLIKDKNQLNEKVLMEKKELLAYYFDLGKCYQQVGSTDKECFQKALDAFNNVVNMASQKSRYWWKAKYEYYKTQEKRGSEDDFKELGGELRALQRSNPDFKEAATMQPKFQELVRELEAKGIKIN